MLVKDKVLKDIEKLTKFSKRVSGRDKKPKVLESIGKIHDMAKKVEKGESIQEEKQEPVKKEKLEKVE